MPPDSLRFPVLCIHKGTIVTERNLDALTTTTMAALRGGLYSDLRIIDSEGVEAIVASAKKLHGVGPFFGFNIFLNQSIRVALDLKLTGLTLTTDSVRELVLKDFRNWHGWKSRGDFDELKDAVKVASSVKEILQLVIGPAVNTSTK